MRKVGDSCSCGFVERGGFSAFRSDESSVAGASVLTVLYRLDAEGV